MAQTLAPSLQFQKLWSMRLNETDEIGGLGVYGFPETLPIITLPALVRNMVIPAQTEDFWLSLENSGGERPFPVSYVRDPHFHKLSDFNGSFFYIDF